MSDYKALLSILNQDGHESRLVGGVVRHMLSGEIISDWDIATTRTPEQVMEVANAHNIKAIPTGLVHGTVTLVHQGQPYEVTTLRKDVSTDGRRATVAFSKDWEEDAARRDFTINAMSMDMNGGLYDYHNGKADLAAGRLRFIGNPDTRIKEDYLRILRYFRFLAQYDMHPDEAYLRIINANIAGLAQLSKERVLHEYLKLLHYPAGYAVCVLLEQAGAHAALQLPSLQPVVEEYKTEGRPFSKWAMYFSAEQYTITSWPFSKQQRALLCFEKENAGEWDEAAWRCWWRAQHKQTLDADACWQRMLLLGEASGMPLEALHQQYKQLLAWKIPTFPLTATDVMAAHGLQGKALGDALTQAETYWETEGYKPDREMLLEYI